MAKNTGIWIDKRIAKIVFLDGETVQLQTIQSHIEEFNPKGGSGSKLKGGPQDVVQDSKYLAREKLQYKSFFKDIISLVEQMDTLVIFGPAQSGEKFQKEISTSCPALAQKIIAVEKADSMTDNQIKAWVKDYFQS